MSIKRISRARKRDLEQPDEFLSVTATLIQRLSRYRTPLAVGVIVVFASLAAFSAMHYFSGQAENRAFQRLTADLRAYQAAVTTRTPREALEQVKPQFESLLADDGQREGGKLARLVYADLNYRAGEYEGAIANYEQSLALQSPGDFAYGSALLGLGYAYLEAGARDKAIGCFEKIVAGNYPQLQADALFQLGLLFGEQGDTAKQKELFQRLLDEAPTFVYADLIRRKIES
jgi:tetratricopeptide (TPR) repeat protein